LLDGVSAPMCPRNAAAPAAGVQPGKNPAHLTHFNRVFRAGLLPP